jgi:uncharacterized protein YodC (DUF2158 family)
MSDKKEEWKTADRVGRYKVTYYSTGQMVLHKWFDTFSEASEFSVHSVKTGDVIEVKWYPNES